MMKGRNLLVFLYIYLVVFLLSFLSLTLLKIVNIPLRWVEITITKELYTPVQNQQSIKKEDIRRAYTTPYDHFRNNMTAYDQILYVQRNYAMYDTLQRQQLLNEVIESINNHNNHLERNVVFQEMKETGLGNSMLALASSFMVSRLLNASFHVFWPLYSKSFDSPLVSIATNIGYNTKEESYSKWKIRWSGCLPKLHTLEAASLQELVPNRNLVITAYFDYTNHLFKSGQYDEILKANGLLPLSPSLPSSSSLQRTFNTEFSLMTAVRLFFQPKPYIQQQIHSFLTSYSSYHLIGFQIRMGSGGADFRDSHKFLRMSALEKFIQFAEEYRIANHFAEEEVKWFISTDSSEVERNLTSRFPSRIIVARGYTRGHSAQLQANVNAFNRAIMDVSILSQCEYMILTNHSSFGMIARMIAPKPAFAIVPAIGY